MRHSKPVLAGAQWYPLYGAYPSSRLNRSAIVRDIHTVRTQSLHEGGGFESWTVSSMTGW